MAGGLNTYDIVVSIPVPVMILSNIIPRIIKPNDNNDILNDIHDLDLLDDLYLRELNVDVLAEDDVLVVLIPATPGLQLTGCPNQSPFNGGSLSRSKSIVWKRA